MVLSHFAIQIKNIFFEKFTKNYQHQHHLQPYTTSSPTPPQTQPSKFHQKNIEKCIKNCSNHLKNMFFDVFEPFRNQNQKSEKMKNWYFFTKNHEKACWPHYRMIKLRVHFHTTPKRKSLIKFDSDLRSPKQNVFFNSARRDLSFKAIKNRGHRAQSKVHGLPVFAHYFCQNHPKSIQCPKILGHPTTKS